MEKVADLTHETVFRAEAVAALLDGGAPAGGDASDAGGGDRAAGGWFVDATFGGGGHSRLLLEQMPADGRLLALDCDEVAAARAAAVCHPRFDFARRDFAELTAVLEERCIAGVCGVLFDLGVSSMQLDDISRGFSFRGEAELDMRLDRRSGVSAADWLRNNDEKTIRAALRRYGEEPEAGRVARALFAARGTANTTTAFADIVRAAKRRPTPGRHPATRAFQALRIVVNDELENLRRGLDAARRALVVGGRLVVIAFHSLEDRIAKRLTFAETFPGFGRVGGGDLSPVGRMRRPSEEEVAANPRARSACLRVFVKTVVEGA